eukprot:gene7600-1358_t
MVPPTRSMMIPEAFGASPALYTDTALVASAPTVFSDSHRLCLKAPLLSLMAALAARMGETIHAVCTQPWELLAVESLMRTLAVSFVRGDLCTTLDHLMVALLDPNPPHGWSPPGHEGPVQVVLSLYNPDMLRIDGLTPHLLFIAPLPAKEEASLLTQTLQDVRQACGRLHVYRLYAFPAESTNPNSVLTCIPQSPLLPLLPETPLSPCPNLLYHHLQGLSPSSMASLGKPQGLALSQMGPEFACTTKELVTLFQRPSQRHMLLQRLLQTACQGTSAALARHFHLEGDSMLTLLLALCHVHMSWQDPLIGQSAPDAAASSPTTPATPPGPGTLTHSGNNLTPLAGPTAGSLSWGWPDLVSTKHCCCQPFAPCVPGTCFTCKQKQQAEQAVQDRPKASRRRAPVASPSPKKPKSKLNQPSRAADGLHRKGSGTLARFLPKAEATAALKVINTGVTGSLTNTASTFHGEINAYFRRVKGGKPDELEYLPLPPGFMLRIAQRTGADPPRGDPYWTAPDGTRCRSLPEIITYLENRDWFGELFGNKGKDEARSSEGPLPDATPPAAADTDNKLSMAEAAPAIQISASITSGSGVQENETSPISGRGHRDNCQCVFCKPFKGDRSGGRGASAANEGAASATQDAAPCATASKKAVGGAREVAQSVEQSAKQIPPFAGASPNIMDGGHQQECRCRFCSARARTSGNRPDTRPAGKQMPPSSPDAPQDLVAQAPAVQPAVPLVANASSTVQPSEPLSEMVTTPGLPLIDQSHRTGDRVPPTPPLPSSDPLKCFLMGPRRRGISPLPPIALSVAVNPRNGLYTLLDTAVSSLVPPDLPASSADEQSAPISLNPQGNHIDTPGQVAPNSASASPCSPESLPPSPAPAVAVAPDLQPSQGPVLDAGWVQPGAPECNAGEESDGRLSRASTASPPPMKPQPRRAKAESAMPFDYQDEKEKAIVAPPLGIVPPKCKQPWCRKPATHRPSFGDGSISYCREHRTLDMVPLDFPSVPPPVSEPVLASAPSASRSSLMTPCGSSRSLSIIPSKRTARQRANIEHSATDLSFQCTNCGQVFGPFVTQGMRATKASRHKCGRVDKDTDDEAYNSPRGAKTEFPGTENMAPKRHRELPLYPVSTPGQPERKCHRRMSVSPHPSLSDVPDSPQRLSRRALSFSPLLPHPGSPDRRMWPGTNGSSSPFRPLGRASPKIMAPSLPSAPSGLISLDPPNPANSYYHYLDENGNSQYYEIPSLA